MKVKLLINNDMEIEAEITEEEYNKLLNKSKETGYELKFQSKDNKYYYIDDSSIGQVETDYDTNRNLDCNRYNNANYYSNKKVAQNNARADTLMRELRRFAREHQQNNINWNDVLQNKYQIRYNYSFKEIIMPKSNSIRDFGAIYFDSEEIAQEAINKFRDELIWYFKTYKDSI